MPDGRSNKLKKASTAFTNIKIRQRTAIGFSFIYKFYHPSQVLKYKFIITKMIYNKKH